MLIQIRFNTDTLKDPETNQPFWRVIYSGQEHLAWGIRIFTSSWTSCDDIGGGVLKWHITTEGRPVWDEKTREVEIHPE